MTIITQENVEQQIIQKLDELIDKDVNEYAFWKNTLIILTEKYKIKELFNQQIKDKE